MNWREKIALAALFGASALGACTSARPLAVVHRTGGPDAATPSTAAPSPSRAVTGLPASSSSDPVAEPSSEPSAAPGHAESPPTPPPIPSLGPVVSTSTDSGTGVVIQFAQPLLASPPTANGHVVFVKAENHHVYRIEARSGATEVDIDRLLDSVAPLAPDVVPESAASLSWDGEWLALTTKRFGCLDWDCLVLAPIDLSRVEIVATSMGQVHSPSVVASGGGVVAFAETGRDHATDIWVTRRSSQGWSAPLNVSANSPYAFNSSPNFDPQGAKLVFDCGPQPYGDPGTAICEVNADGTGFRVAVSAAPPEADGTSSGPYFHRPSYGPDGTIYFETSWPFERAAYLSPTTNQPVDVEPGALDDHVFGDDNSPCVLPNGQIVSLWLGRPGNVDSLHELKIMPPTAASYFIVMPGEEVFDGGHFCGK